MVDATISEILSMLEYVEIPALKTLHEALGQNNKTTFSYLSAIGLKVTPWTVDEPEDMIKMIQWQVDGIITNRPDILRGLLAARGYKVPASN